MLNQILVVDDVGYTRALFQQALSHEGYEVTCVETGAEALRFIENELPSLVILDINLPDITGIDVLEEMRQKRRKIPVVMITARDTDQLYEKAMDLGAHAFLSKPVDLNEFLDLVDYILDPATHILIVDDEPSTLELYSRFLEAENYKVSTSENGEEAQKLLLNRSYDAVILDLNLPGIDGVEILRSLRKQGESLPVLVTTGYANYLTEKELDEFTIDGFMEKPINPEEMLKIIKNILGSIKYHQDNDFIIIEMAGKVQNSSLFKRIISVQIKDLFNRFIFDITNVSMLSGSVTKAMLTLLGKDVLATRIVAQEGQDLDFLKQVPPAYVCFNKEAAKMSINDEAARQREVEAALGFQQPQPEKRSVPIADLQKVKGETYTIITVPVVEAKPGMILAEPVFNETGRVALLSEDVELDAESIKKIQALDYVYKLSIKLKH